MKGTLFSLPPSLSPQEIVDVGDEVGEEFRVGRRLCVENHFFCGHCYQCTHGQHICVLITTTQEKLIVEEILW